MKCSVVAVAETVQLHDVSFCEELLHVTLRSEQSTCNDQTVQPQKQKQLEKTESKL